MKSRHDLSPAEPDANNKKGDALYLNLMRCEAHYDVSREVIKNKLREYSK